MKLTDRQYKEFKVSEIFIVKYGVNLELNACIECDRTDPDAVNFVARTAENNGVSAYVKKIDGIPPQKSGLISVAGGGSVLSTFLQSEPFYSGRDLYTLDSKYAISDEAKMFVITVIEKNKYKYSYGRQANKTLPDLLLKLPVDNDGNPDWQFMEDYIKSLHHKPLTTKNRYKQILNLNVENWKYVLLKDICKITMGNKMDASVMTSDKPEVNFVGRSADNNGVACKVDIVYDNKGERIEPYPAGCITVALGGSLGSTFLQKEPFYTSQNVSVLEFSNNVSDAAKLFICTLIYNESKYKYFPFGRELNTHIRTDYGFTIPVTSKNEPDWEFMENYMKSLPYGDRI